MAKGPSYKAGLRNASTAGRCASAGRRSVATVRLIRNYVIAPFAEGAEPTIEPIYVGQYTYLAPWQIDQGDGTCDCFD